MLGNVNAVMRRIEEIEQAVSGADASALQRGRSVPISIERMVARGAQTWSVDPALVQAIIANESGFNPRARSRTGAMGLMQLEPQTAAAMGVGNPYDPKENILAGTRYIHGLLERYHGDMRLALAAYNAGPGAVERYGGIPPYAETQSYVERVLAAYHTYKARL